MIQFEHVSKSYGKTPVLKDLNFTIPDGQFVVLIGPSGCGKTTTMKMINRLLEPDSGTILIDGKDIHSQDKVELRRHIGYVIQQIGLFPNMTVAQNICVVPKLLKYDKARCDEIVQEMLQLVHMEQYANKYPSELSGGQQQRIGVLRALAASPPIVLMDEPFSALDPLTREALQDEVKNLQQKLNKTIVFVSHDMSEALKLADIIIFMAAGEMVQMASPEEMLEHPANDLVRTFMGKHTPDTAPSKVESFMRTNVFSVRKDRGVLECAERMARGSVDTLLVTDEQNRYLGTVSIGDIRHWGRELTSIEPLIRQTARTVRVGDEAKESFDYLLDSGANYVVVLNADDTIAGIVTKTSVARSVAENLWGDVQMMTSDPGLRRRPAAGHRTAHGVCAGLRGHRLCGGTGVRHPPLPDPPVALRHHHPDPLHLPDHPRPGVHRRAVHLVGQHLSHGDRGPERLRHVPGAEKHLHRHPGGGAHSTSRRPRAAACPRFQTLVRVELPLAMPVIIAGLRMAAIYTVSWAVLASMIGLGGLGDFVYRGTSSNNNTLILLGAIPAALLAIVFGAVIDLLQKKVTPRGLRKEAGK